MFSIFIPHKSYVRSDTAIQYNCTALIAHTAVSLVNSSLSFSQQVSSLSPLYSIVHSVHHSQTEHPPDPVNLNSEGAHKTQCVQGAVINLFIDYKVHLIWGHKISSSDQFTKIFTTSVSQHVSIHSTINKALLALYHKDYCH